MKATKIFYKKLFGLGNFENEQIGIELEIEEGETATQVLDAAKQFVNGLSPNDKKKKEYDSAVKVLEQKDGYSYRRVIDAQDLVKEYEKAKGDEFDLPF